MMNEPNLTYALNKEGELVYILDVEEDCTYFCPNCKAPLSVKIGHGLRQPHFAHKAGNNCHGAYMSALHLLAEKIISEQKKVMGPSYKEKIPARQLIFVDVELEKRTDRSDIQPDLVGITEDDRRWLIEIKYTHEVDKDKRSKIKEYGLSCLEIDVSKQTLENLEKFLFDSTNDREWINNPNYEQEIQLIKQKYKKVLHNLLAGNYPELTPKNREIQR